jgi:beta-barrel assembly-enhancing protease
MRISSWGNRTVGVVLTMLLLCGTGTTAAHAQLKFKLGKSQETAMGQDMYRELKPKLVTRGKEYDMVQRVGRRIVEFNDLREYDYTFHLVKDDSVNAFATPGGFLYVHTGLLKYMAYDESMLAGVMAHEIGHAKDRHVARGAEKQMQSQLGVGLLGMLLGEKNKDLVKLVGGASAMANLKYSRDMEEWADTHGVELAYNAGYDPYGMARGLKTLQGLYGKGGGFDEWLSNHPSNSSRVKRTARIAQEVSGQSEGYWAIPCPPKGHPLYDEYRGKCGSGKQIDAGYPLRSDEPQEYKRIDGRPSRRSGRVQ